MSKLSPSVSPFLRQAIHLHEQGRLDEAAQRYARISPDGEGYADALALLSVLRSGQGRYAEARQLIAQALALDPQAPLFHFYAGENLAAEGDSIGALAAFAACLQRQPDFAQAHYRSALVLEQAGRRTEAVAALQQTVALRSDDIAAWVALADLARQEGQFDLAAQAAAQAARLNPDHLAAHLAHSAALDLLDREEEAETSLRQALRLQPELLAAWDMLGTTLQNLGRLDEAQSVMHHALALSGSRVLLAQTGEVDEADYNAQHWNLALYELLRGDYASGFKRYRARFALPGRTPRLPLPRPVWRGEDLTGKKILAVGEQGFGDVLMMCRFLPLLKARGAHVTLLVHEALAALLRSAGLAEHVISSAPVTQGDYDFQTSLFDLPYRLTIDLQTLPNAAPYLRSPPVTDDRRLPHTGRRRIGVCWAGRPDFANDRRRSLSLQIFSQLFSDKRMAFYSFNRETRAGDAAILTACGVTDLTPRLDNFLTTAALVSQCDLMITCDTALAHLAGALGKPVWILLPFAADWRWLAAGDSSPWYPTARLFRQRVKADWQGVIDTVRQELDLL